MSEHLEGVDGTTPVYRERLHAPVWLWVLTFLLAASLGVAYAHRVGTGWGIGAFVVAQLALGAALLATTTVVVVDDRVLRAGRARLPLRHVGRIVPLDAARTREVRGPKADSRAHLCLRGWVSSSILVEVDDPDDPHPYWLVSTRRGTQLAPILAGARDAARRDVAG